jgi:trehalose 6-phosphate phosphatase
VTPPPLAQADAGASGDLSGFRWLPRGPRAAPAGRGRAATLAPILHRLWRRTGGALALVSGRPVAELRAFLPGPPCRFAAVTGPSGAVHGARTHALAIDNRRGALAQAATARGGRVDGAAGPVAGTQARGPRPALPGRAGSRRRGRSALAEAASSRSARVHAHHGKMVVELRPDGIGKGHAVRDLMRSAPFQGRHPRHVRR